MAMAAESKRVLDPVERLSEILFGLIMAMTFTGSIHVASDGNEEIRLVLIGAVGCNVAWGIVDAVMYVLTDLVERNRSLLLLRSLQEAGDRETARRLIVSVLPERVARALRPEELAALQLRLLQDPVPEREPLVTMRSLRGAAGVFLLVSLSTSPLVLPFVFFTDAAGALRVSHGIGLVMLFVVGNAFGRYSGQRPLVMGTAMVAVGVVLVAVALALGG